MANPAKINAAPPHCGGATWLWFGALDHNMAGLGGTAKPEKYAIEKKKHWIWPQKARKQENLWLKLGKNAAPPKCACTWWNSAGQTNTPTCNTRGTTTKMSSFGPLRPKTRLQSVTALETDT